MSTIARLITASIISLLMTSCVFDLNIGEGVTGNRNVTKENRYIDKDFNAVKISRGIEVYITQDNTINLSVEADENLHEIITTEVENNVLRISTTANIKSSASKKVMLSVKDLSSIKASSGAYVSSSSTFKTSELNLYSSSGSHIDIDVKTEELFCDSSSGSGIKLSGDTNRLEAEASSGSYIKASNLDTQVSRVNASSGSNISVNTSKELTAKASSGGNIKYSGNPEIVNKKNGVSGSIRKQ
ncbi:head GIN domain-containing protein [Winogradskyella immobilis]|uniref:DUF2807 domain-containing protein n=1 Tax=Winogradskyella immobilis TaxID=2816852 RepID=A0ABS8EP37_9FLAO|nr:head GIN domain-containing protein [Winogradskyella immobilis]MCC1484968.1 DUF2807 domain-containing protein [Winogradskyella immobilis]MCG0017060.1 DUF2807 domain-containing protein [Winogradskyella immobilis]